MLLHALHTSLTIQIRHIMEFINWNTGRMLVLITNYQLGTSPGRHEGLAHIKFVNKNAAQDT